MWFVIGLILITGANNECAIDDHNLCLLNDDSTIFILVIQCSNQHLTPCTRNITCGFIWDADSETRRGDDVSIFVSHKNLASNKMERRVPITISNSYRRINNSCTRDAAFLEHFARNVRQHALHYTFNTSAPIIRSCYRECERFKGIRRRTERRCSWSWCTDVYTDAQRVFAQRSRKLFRALQPRFRALCGSHCPLSHPWNGLSHKYTPS